MSLVVLEPMTGLLVGRRGADVVKSLRQGFYGLSFGGSVYVRLYDNMSEGFTLAPLCIVMVRVFASFKLERLTFSAYSPVSVFPVSSFCRLALSGWEGSVEIAWPDFDVRRSCHVMDMSTGRLVRILGSCLGADFA